MSEQYKIEIIYPKEPGSHFDWDHYLSVHSPLALSTAIKHTQVARYDVARPLDEEASPHHCLSTLFFDTRDDMQKLLEAFASPAFADVVADQDNFTNVAPLMVPGIHYEWNAAAERVR